MDLIEDAASFIEQLYDMNETEVREYVDSNSRNDYVYIFFSYKQLGRSEAWFREQCRNLNNDMTLIKREILCEWAFSSENSPFSENELTEIENFKKDPVSSILFNKRFNIEVFEEMDAKRPYIASIDVSGGLSRDFSDISISDPYDLRTVAHFSSNKIDTPDLEEMIRFLNSLFPEMFYIIERNSYGLNVIQHLLKDPVLAKRVFYTEDVDKTVQNSAGGKPVPKRTYGINTNPQTRPKILEAFYILVTEEPYTLIAPKIIENTKTLEVKKNGKIEHAEGCCDDAVFSKAFAKYCMIHHYNTMKRFLHGADRVQNGSAPREHRLNVSKFNRKGFMEKPDGAINTIISQGSQFIDETSASNSKLFKVAQLNHLRKQDVGLIYKDRNDGIDPEKYFEKYKNNDRRKKYVIS